MDMNRRSFLRGALILTASTALAPTAFKVLEAVSPLPILFADGVGDDTLALQALLDGKPFRTSDGFAGSAHSGLIADANLLLTDTIRVRTNGFLITRCRIDGTRVPTEKPLIVYDADYCGLTNCYLTLADQGGIVRVNS